MDLRLIQFMVVTVVWVVLLIKDEGLKDGGLFKFHPVAIGPLAAFLAAVNQRHGNERAK
jgi:hypothetical protein